VGEAVVMFVVGLVVLIVEGEEVVTVALLVVFVELTPLGGWVGVVSSAAVGFTKPGFQQGLLDTSP